MSAQSLALRPSKTPVLRLFYFHYMFGHQRGRFESFIRYAQSIGEFVSTDRMVDILRGRSPLEHNTFHVSFDDGLKCIIENALPILKEYAVPAIIFVPTTAVSSLDGTTRRVSPDYVVPVPGAGFASWDDLEKACAAGFRIGSHSRSHARLSLIWNSRTAVEDEIFGSKEDLESRLGDSRYISLPFGRREDIEDGVLEIVRRAGYEACFGAFRGRIVPNVTDVFRIPRHHLEPDWPMSHVRCFVHGAWEAK